MAVKFITDNPSDLLTCFRQAIDKKLVDTWSYDDDGDFTHTPAQWKNKAWFRPEIKNRELVFGIIKPQQSDLTWEVYGIYHGRMIESVIIHCHALFTNGVATANPTNDDSVS